MGNCSTKPQEEICFFRKSLTRMAKFVHKLPLQCRCWHKECFASHLFRTKSPRKKGCSLNARGKRSLLPRACKRLAHTAGSAEARAFDKKPGRADRTEDGSSAPPGGNLPSPSGVFIHSSLIEQRQHPAFLAESCRCFWISCKRRRFVVYYTNTLKRSMPHDR